MLDAAGWVQVCGLWRDTSGRSVYTVIADVGELDPDGGYVGRGPFYCLTIGDGDESASIHTFDPRRVLAFLVFLGFPEIGDIDTLDV